MKKDAMTGAAKTVPTKYFLTNTRRSDRTRLRTSRSSVSSDTGTSAEERTEHERVEPSDLKSKLPPGGRKTRETGGTAMVPAAWWLLRKAREAAGILSKPRQRMPIELLIDDLPLEEFGIAERGLHEEAIELRLRERRNGI